jgi:hypothetical protein
MTDDAFWYSRIHQKTKESAVGSADWYAPLVRGSIHKRAGVNVSWPQTSVHRSDGW